MIAVNRTPVAAVFAALIACLIPGDACGGLWSAVKTAVDAMPPGAVYDTSSGELTFLTEPTVGAIQFSSWHGTLLDPTGQLPSTVRVGASLLPGALTLFSTDAPFPSSFHLGQILQDSGSASLVWGVITPTGGMNSDSRRVLIVPEPSALLSLVFGSLTLFLRRRH